jgi:hypothetical protein
MQMTDTKMRLVKNECCAIHSGNQSHNRYFMSLLAVSTFCNDFPIKCKTNWKVKDILLCVLTK